MDGQPLPLAAAQGHEPPAALYRPFGAFRFLLALLVALQHLQYLLPAAWRAPFSHAGLGALAVGVFFALSGFIVAEASARFYRNRPAAFLLNRLLRVVPPYLAAMLLSAAVQWLLWRADRLVLWDFPATSSPLDPVLLAGGVLSLLPGFHTALLSRDWEYIPFVWTLRVEMAFYLLVFASGLLAAWLARTSWSAARRAGRAIGPGVVVLGLAASGLYFLHGGASLLSDLPFFLFGLCLHAAHQRRSPARLAAAVLAAVLSLAGFCHWGQRGDPWLALQLPLLAALLLLFVHLAGRHLPQGRRRRLDRRLGELSYPLYLNHYVVGIALFDIQAARGALPYAAGVAGSLLLATLAHRLVEVPAEGLRARIRGRRL